MKRILTIVTILLTGLLLVSCGGKREEPTLDVPLEITVYQGIKTDISEYVESKDQDGNDLNETIKIDSEDESIVVSGSFITANELGSFIIEVTVNDLKNKSLKTSKKIFVDVLESDEVEEGQKTTYKFDKVSEESLNGFKALVGEEEKELSVHEGELIYRNALNNSKIVKELTLEENSNYRVSLVLRASETLEDVKLSLLGEEEVITITEELTTFTIELNDASENTAELTLDLLNNEEFNLYVERMEIVKFEGEHSSVVLDLDKFNYYNDNGESTKKVEDNKIVIDITDPHAGIWEQKLIKTGIELEANKKYILTYEIKASEDIHYEYIARTLSQQAGERDENYIWSAPHADKDEVKFVKHTFETNDEDIHDFEMFFQLGGQKNKTVIEISNIKLENYDEYEEHTTRFTGISELDSFEGDDAIASLYVDTELKALIYDVEQFGKTDWHNKVFIENLVFEEDSRYKVEFTAKADRVVELFFAVNPMGQWEPKITDVIELTEEYQTFTFETDSFQSFTQNFEMLFQFGEFNTGSAKIMFESIVVTQLVRK